MCCERSEGALAQDLLSPCIYVEHFHHQGNKLVDDLCCILCHFQRESPRTITLKTHSLIDSYI